MKVTVFNGSPRAEQSVTNIIAEAFLEGAKLAGAEVDNVFLIKKDINHCCGCFSCWFKTPGQCVFKDDMQDLIEKYMSSDIICLGTPVYTWNMTATLKNFVDRLVPLRSPITTQTDGNFDMKVRVKFPETVVISNCGFPGDNNFEIIKEVFKPCNPILEIYRNCGRLFKINKTEIKAIAIEYLESVKNAGYEIAINNKVSDSTKIKLQVNLMESDEYLKMMNI